MPRILITHLRLARLPKPIFSLFLFQKFRLFHRENRQVPAVENLQQKLETFIYIPQIAQRNRLQQLRLDAVQHGQRNISRDEFHHAQNRQRFNIDIKIDQCGRYLIASDQSFRRVQNLPIFKNIFPDNDFLQPVIAILNRLSIKPLKLQSTDAAN
jgi:hypothetical protein